MRIVFDAAAKPGKARVFPAHHLTKLIAFGFVETQNSRSGWRISKRGREALRRAVSGAGPAAATGKRGHVKPAPQGAMRPIVDEKESPLAWLSRRRGRDGKALVGPAQFAAGERLRQDFWRAQLQPRVTIDWTRAAAGGGTRTGGVGSGLELSELAVQARQRVNAALSAVGPELSGVLIDVCCHLKGLEVSERNHGWPQRSTKIVLLLALTRLARHYGLECAGESAGPTSRRVRHWGDGDYRPQI